MTTDINGLMREARGWHAGHSNDSQRMVWLMNKLCDALEAMAGEVERLKDRDAINATCHFQAAEINKLETERDRLKAALEPFAKLSTDRERQDPPEGTMRVRVVTAPEIEAARKALGGDAS